MIIVVYECQECSERSEGDDIPSDVEHSLPHTWIKTRGCIFCSLECCTAWMTRAGLK